MRLGLIYLAVNDTLEILVQRFVIRDQDSYIRYESEGDDVFIVRLNVSLQRALHLLNICAWHQL
ncbi:MAG: hypothetical protein OXO48_08565 [Caldilineaceae bacterium]|nr:hypothetical protein [Caldilineaceae bacterium]